MNCLCYCFNSYLLIELIININGSFIIMIHYYLTLNFVIINKAVIIIVTIFECIIEKVVFFFSDYLIVILYQIIQML